MSFNNYKSLQAVLKEFELNYVEEDYITQIEYQVNEYFKSELELVLQEGIYDNSEAAICEALIYPILKEIWKSYKDKLSLWSHQPLNYDEQLTGVPDYLVCQKSPLGKIIFDQPYCVVVEAKKDNFTEGWGQCVAEMIAAQKLNENKEQSIFGIVSNGKTWEFCKLKIKVFTKYIKIYTIQNLELLLATVNDVFHQCYLQIDNK